MIEELRKFVESMLLSANLIKVKTIRSIGRNVLRIEHDSGSGFVLSNDGKTYVSSELNMGTNTISDVDTIVSESSTDLTLESGTGIFVFKSS